MTKAEYLRDKYTFAKPCVVGGDEEFPEAQTVWLKIGVQSFRLDGFFETKQDAEWTRSMLGVALLSMLDAEQSLEPGYHKP